MINDWLTGMMQLRGKLELTSSSGSEKLLSIGLTFEIPFPSDTWQVEHSVHSVTPNVTDIHFGPSKTVISATC
jgi:hypothetical protein